VRRDSAPTVTQRRAPTSEAATHAQIEFRAYEIFLARGGAQRHDLADWFKAERELNG